MLRIANILCPVDFSPGAQAALSIACALARDYGATLTLLHVRETPPAVVGEFGSIPPEPPVPDETLKARMRRSVPEGFPGVPECEVRDGDAADTILKTARRRKCDLIVLGTHGLTGLSRLLVGSVAEVVLRGAPCPVLTIRPKAAESAPSEPSDEANVEPRFEPTDLITVCSVATPMEAEVIHNALTGEGITSFVEGAQQAGLVGTLGIPVRIQVRVGDFNRANKFIEKREAHRGR